MITNNILLKDVSIFGTKYKIIHHDLLRGSINLNEDVIHIYGYQEHIPRKINEFLPDFSKKVENIRTGYRYEKPQMGKVY